MTIESCGTNLKNISVKEANKIIRETTKKLKEAQEEAARKGLLKSPVGDPLSKKGKEELQKILTDPSELEKIKSELHNLFATKIEDGLEMKTRQVADLVKTQDLYDKITTNPFNGESYKTMSDVIHNRLKMLVGRNSIDTKLRTLRNHFRNQIDVYESMFKTNENPTFKSLRSIKKGTDEERILYKKVWEFTEQLDVDKMTPEMVQGLLKKYPDELDRLALAMVSYNEYSRKLMGKFGISVKYNRNYVMKRRYDWAPMEKMGRDEWAKYMVKKLDIAKTFGEKVTQEEALIRLGYGKSSGGVWHDFEKNAGKRTSPMSNKSAPAGDKSTSFETKFVYKDADAAYDTFRDMSVGGMREQFEHNAMRMAGTSIQISEFGYDTKFVSKMLQEMLDDSYGTKLGMVDQWREQRIIQAERELMGQNSIVQGGITNFSNNVRFMTAFTKLGTTLATTIADMVENNRQAFYVNGDLFGGIKQWADGVRQQLFSMTAEQRQEVANAFGVILSHQSNNEALRMASGDLATNGGALTTFIQTHGGKALNIATLLPSQTGYSKIASALTGASSFSKLLNDTLDGKANKFQTDTLKEYGLSEKELGMIKKLVKTTDTWGRPIYTPTDIRRILDTSDPQTVAKELGIEPEKAGRAVMELSTKYESFLNDFFSRGTPTPELATKTLLFKSVDSEVLRAVINITTQFMDTPMAMAENVADLSKKLARINTKNGNLDKAGITGDILSHLGVYTTVGVSSYLAADYLMSMVTNSEPMMEQIYNGNSEQRRKALTKAIGRIGAVPYVAELFDNQWGGGYNKTALNTFVGPNWGMLNDAAKVLQDNDEGGMEMMEFLKRQGPSNAIPVRLINNAVGTATGTKIWDDNKGTFF